MSSIEDLRNYITKKKEYLGTSEYTTLLNLFDKIKINEDSEFMRLKEDADLQYRKGDFKSALNLYSKYLERRMCAIILNNRSACFYKLRMYDESVSDCIKGIQINKKYLKFYIRLAVIEKERGNKEEADKWVKEGLEIEETNKILNKILNKA